MPVPDGALDSFKAHKGGLKNNGLIGAEKDIFGVLFIKILDFIQVILNVPVINRLYIIYKKWAPMVPAAASLKKSLLFIITSK